MMGSGVLRVSGVPGSHGDDLVLDKLLLHFLRRKNGGDGEVEVRYPTEERGVAMLTFDLVEVADRVLTRGHKLEIGGYTYPLEVSRPKRQFSMPITTTVSLEYFTDTSEVRRLLEKHNLKVYGEGNAYLQIKGDFQDLSRCRDELYKTMVNSSFAGKSQTGNRASRRGKDVTEEDCPGGFSREEAHMQKSNGKQSPVNSLLDTASCKTSSRNPSPIRTRRTPESQPAENEGYGSTKEKNRQPYIKPLLTQNERPGSNQRKPKDTSTNDSTTTRKHSRSIAANFSSAPPKKVSAEEDKRPNSNSVLASGKPADSSGLASHMALPSTQLEEDLPKSRQPKDAFATDSISSQRKPKGTIGDEFTSNPKNSNSTTGDGMNFRSGKPKDTSTDGIATNLNVHPGLHKETFADKDRRQEMNSPLARDRKPSGNAGLVSDTAYTSMLHGNDGPESRQPNATHSTDSSSSQSKPKDTFLDDLISNPKHISSTIGDCSSINLGQPKNTSTGKTATSLNAYPSFIKGTFADRDRSHDRNSPEASVNPGQLENRAIAHPSSSKETIADKDRRQDRNTPEASVTPGQLENRSKDLNAHPSLSKETFADRDRSHDRNSPEASVNPGQLENRSTDLNVHPSSSKDTFTDKGRRQERNSPEASVNPGQLENRSKDVNAHPSSSKETFANKDIIHVRNSPEAIVVPGQLENRATDLKAYPSKETIADKDKRQDRNLPLARDRRPSGSSALENVHREQPRNTSIDHIATNSNVHPSSLIETFAEKERRQDRNSPEASVTSGQLENRSIDLKVHPSSSKETFAEQDRRQDRNSPEASVNPGQLENRSTGLNVHPSSSKETFVNKDRRQERNLPLARDRRPSGSSALENVHREQHRSTSIDHIATNSNVHPSSLIETFTEKERIQDRNSPEAHDRKPSGSSGLHSVHLGHPKNMSADKLNSNLKLPESTHRGSGNPRKHENTSLENITLNPGYQQDLSSAYRSSHMAAGRSPLSSPTDNSSTASNSGNLRDQNPLSTEILVDPAAQTCVSMFMKDKLIEILGQSVQMVTETCEGYNRVTLTAGSLHLSQLFYKAVRDISDIFMKCQSFLRFQNIDVSNIPADVTGKLQKYLFHCGIWSMGDRRRLQMIGPSDDILGFMEKWTSANGDFEKFLYLAQKGVGSARPPVVGMDNVNPSTAPNHSVMHEAQGRRATSREPGAGRGRGRGDTNIRSKSPWR